MTDHQPPSSSRPGSRSVPAVRPRHRVRFTITGAFDLDLDADPDGLAAASGTATAQARRLLVDLTGVEGLLSGSVSLRVHVDDVRLIDE